MKGLNLILRTLEASKYPKCDVAVYDAIEHFGASNSLSIGHTIHKLWPPEVCTPEIGNIKYIKHINEL